MSTLQIISGGQTGVDQIALRVAYDIGLRTGGHIPDGFVTTNGKEPFLGLLYGLTELGTPNLSLAKAYVQRSKLNVDCTDATLAFSFYPSKGTDATIRYCVSGSWESPKKYGERSNKGFPEWNGHVLKKNYRPVYVVRGDQVCDVNAVDRTTEELVNFLSTHKVKKLNVAGHRSLDTKHCIQVEQLLRQVLTGYVNLL
jgi:hypothetical protein